MKHALIAAVAALAISSVAAQAQGLPPGVYENSQPHPQWSQAERQAAADPVSWFQHLFGGGNQQPTNVASNQAKTGVAPSAQD